MMFCCVCVCVPCACLVPKISQERVWAPGTGVTVMNSCLGSGNGTQVFQEMLLTAEPTPQP